MNLRHADANWGKQSDAERSPQDQETSPHGIISQGVDVFEVAPHTRTQGRGVTERSPHTISHGAASIEQRPHTFTLGTDSVEPRVNEGAVIHLSESVRHPADDTDPLLPPDRVEIRLLPPDQQVEIRLLPPDQQVEIRLLPPDQGDLRPLPPDQLQLAPGEQVSLLPPEV